MAYAKTTRGRPPRFSRESIAEAVTARVLAEPEAPLTIAWAAAAVGARPMTLYRHFADRDDLVATVVDLVFADTRPPVSLDVGWQVQVRAWMAAVYEQARRVPGLMALVAHGESAEWLASSAYLAEIFEVAGVTDDHTRAEAVYWIAMTTMGHAMIDASGTSPMRHDLISASLRRLTPDDAARITRLLPHYERIRRDAFGAVIDRTIDQVERLLLRRQ